MPPAGVLQAQPILDPLRVPPIRRISSLSPVRYPSTPFVVRSPAQRFFMIRPALSACQISCLHNRVRTPILNSQLSILNSQFPITKFRITNRSVLSLQNVNTSIWPQPCISVQSEDYPLSYTLSDYPPDHKP